MRGDFFLFYYQVTSDIIALWDDQSLLQFYPPKHSCTVATFCILVDFQLLLCLCVTKRFVSPLSLSDVRSKDCEPMENQEWIVFWAGLLQVCISHHYTVCLQLTCIIHFSLNIHSNHLLHFQACWHQNNIPAERNQPADGALPGVARLLLLQCQGAVFYRRQRRVI